MAEMMPGDDQLTGRDVVFTLGRGYRGPLVRRGAIALVVAAIAVVFATAGFVPQVGWSVAALCAAFACSQAVLYLWHGRFRTRLSAQGIEARGYFDHFIPWTEVTGVQVQQASAGPAEVPAIAGKPWDSPAAQPLSRVRLDSEGGYRAKLATVRVTRRGHQPVTLRAPLVTAWRDDPEFEDKARLIKQWWQAYGPGPGAGYQPPDR
jgi:hypothetical protein